MNDWQVCQFGKKNVGWVLCFYYILVVVVVIVIVVVVVWFVVVFVVMVVVVVVGSCESCGEPGLRMYCHVLVCCGIMRLDDAKCGDGTSVIAVPIGGASYLGR